jgi:hypothetical protein
MEPAMGVRLRERSYLDGLNPSPSELIVVGRICGPANPPRTVSTFSPAGRLDCPMCANICS